MSESDRRGCSPDQKGEEAMQNHETILHRRAKIKNNEPNFTSHSTNSKTKKNPFADKIFVPQDSLFTRLYGASHNMRAVYHTFLVSFILLMLNTAIHDFVTKGVLNIGQHTVYTGFRGFWHAIGVWCVMQGAVFLVYYGLKMWAEARIHLLYNDSIRQFWDLVCLLLFVAFQIFFMCAVSFTVFRFDFAVVSGSSVLLEMTRFIMKSHAFVRTNAPRILNDEIILDSDDPIATNYATYPSLSQFLYYLFAPTLIYRDQYPRTSRINWRFAGCRFLEVLGVTFFIANIHERFIQPNFADFGKTEISLGDIVTKLFSMILPAMLILLNGFYCILHAWPNFTGELLRFADRLYYKDWWTSANYESYYRNWNIVVHDWLYEFIYKDVFHHVFFGSKNAARMTVFAVSALIHEYILLIGFGFFLPIMLTMFGGLGVTFIFLTKKMNQTAGNIFFWLSFSIGNCLMVCLYAMETYARMNCPITDSSWLSYFIPVMLKCNGLKYM